MCSRTDFSRRNSLPRLGKGTFLRQLRLPSGLPHGNKEIVWAMMLQSQIVMAAPAKGKAKDEPTHTRQRRAPSRHQHG